MKLKQLYLVFLSLIFIGCNTTIENNHSNKFIIGDSNNTESTNPELGEDDSFDKLLRSCNEFAHFGKYLRIPYNGCTYNPTYNKNNELGWADIVLIAKESYQNDFMVYDNNYNR